jgi:hypothetical protein
MAAPKEKPPYYRGEFCEHCRPKVEVLMLWLMGRPNPEGEAWLRRQLEGLGK